eukprot:scaffold282580_cov28-Tisochrysis_lutea.AAC.2
MGPGMPWTIIARSIRRQERNLRTPLNPVEQSHVPRTSSSSGGLVQSCASRLSTGNPMNQELLGMFSSLGLPPAISQVHEPSRSSHQLPNASPRNSIPSFGRQIISRGSPSTQRAGSGRPPRRRGSRTAAAWR